jgi:hypothetical protein
VNRAAAALVLAVFVAGCATPAPSATPVAPAQASPSDAAEGEWQRLDLPNGDASLNAVAATDHDVVIVGGRAMGSVAWVSHDGGAWTFEEMPPGDAFAGTAVAFGDRLIVVGATPTNRCAHPSATFIWVRQADGRWATAPFDKLFCTGDQSTPAVADGRLAMLGTGTADVPFAWFSDDGLSWVNSPMRPNIYPRFLASAGDGFAAIGTFLDDGWWVARSDGREAWTIAPLPNVPVGAQAVGLSGRGNGLIAWFTTPAGDIGALTSETGLVWQSSAVQGMAGTTPGHFIRTAAGYVALGERSDARPGMLVSRDGVTWRAVAGPIDSRPGNYFGLAISGDRAILLGDVRVGDEGTPTVWSGPARVVEP